jgi:hypothetical protein
VTDHVPGAPDIPCPTTNRTITTEEAMTARLTALLHRMRTDDRGDVPGWVLVAVMTAGLVTALWLVADGQLTSLFQRAVTSVTKP